MIFFIVKFACRNRSFAPDTLPPATIILAVVVVLKSCLHDFTFMVAQHFVAVVSVDHAVRTCPDILGTNVVGHLVDASKYPLVRGR